LNVRKTKGDAAVVRRGSDIVAQDPKTTTAKVSRVQQGLTGTAVDGKYGPKTRGALRAEFTQPMSEAIKFAENNKKNHGVLSIKTTNPSQAVTDSVNNNLDRFMVGDQSNDNYDNSGTPRFVDFMQQRWAPYDAQNPAIHVKPKENELNPNWAPNVRAYLQKMYPDKYQQWRAMNLVKSPMQQFEATV